MIFNKRTKKIKSPNLLNNEGQGVVEYILILVVTVLLFTGLIFQFNKSFEVWVNNYFGEYLACLLETGELPTLGGGVDSTSTCARFFNPFSFTANSDDIAFEGGSGGSGGDASRLGDSQSSAEKIASSTSSRRGVGSGRSSRSGRSGQFGGTSQFKKAGFGGGSRGVGGEDSDDKVYTGSTNASTPAGLLQQNGRSVKIQRDRSGINSDFLVDGREEGEEKQEKFKTKKKNSENTMQNRSPARFKLTAPRAKVVEKAELDVGFGDYLRYLIIAAIIIAIVIFFGGQALQMSKSMD